MKRWTMPDGKTRNACTGPFVSPEDMADFKEFCTRNGITFRDHTGIYSSGYQVRHQGHWMALLWNKGTKRFTADRRLTLIVQSFAAERAHGIGGEA